MGTKERISVISAIVLFCFCLQVHSQNQGGWDRTLDRYELICERCIELLEQKRSGKDVPQESLSSLLTQLSLLKSSLNEADRQMSPAQKMRFEMIRRRFAAIQTGNPDSSGSTLDAGAGRTEDNVTRATARPTAVATTAPPDTMAATGRQKKPVLPAISGTFPVKVSAVQNSAPESIDRLPAAAPVASSGAKGELLAGLQAGAFPAFTLGAFAAFCPGRYGFYLKGRADLAGKAPDHSFTLNSDGRIDGGGKIWSDGGQCRKRSVATAGAVFKAGPMAIYAGAGYGSYRCFMEGPNEQWGFVSDLSKRGLSLDIGLMAGLGSRFFAGVGACTTAFSYSELEITLGLRFGNDHR